MEVWELLKPYHPEDLVPLIVGLLLAFFGGTFLLTIAATEAFLATSYSSTKEHFAVIHDNYLKAKQVRRSVRWWCSAGLMD